MADFTGTPGDDRFVGTNADDYFDISQGGNDTVVGAGGNDEVFVGAALTAADRIYGAGSDLTVLLDGDYSERLILRSHTIQDVGALAFAAGHSYNIKSADGTVANGATMTVDADQLGAGDNFVFDGSAERDGGFVFQFAGPATLTGGDADDTFGLALSGHLDGDKLDGRDGYDVLSLYLVDPSYSFADKTIRNIEKLDLFDGGATLVMADGNVARGAIMSIDATYAASIAFNGSAERDGSFDILGSESPETLIGGAQSDTIAASGGEDLIQGGKGADILSGGYGGDTFVYRSVRQSSPHNADLIVDLDSDDHIDVSAIDARTDLGGNQAFDLVSSFDGRAGELLLRYDGKHDVTTLLGDVDGDKHADLIIKIAGDHTDFSGIVL